MVVRGRQVQSFINLVNWTIWVRLAVVIYELQPISNLFLKRMDASLFQVYHYYPISHLAKITLLLHLLLVDLLIMIMLEWRN